MADYSPESLGAAAANWPAESRAALVQYLDSSRRRSQILTRYRDTVDLALALEPGYVATPALRLIAHDIEVALTRPRHNLLVTCPPQEGKAVSDHELVPTLHGWKKHGELANGDWVFHPSGTPIRVRAVHKPALGDCRVHFSDHTFLDVHENHEWTVQDRSSHSWRTMETGRLDTLKLSSGPPGHRGHNYRFHLPLREAVELPEAGLPCDPYALGVWLGDGTSTKPAITHHPDDVYELPFPIKATMVHATTGILTTYYGGGFRDALQAAGVFGAVLNSDLTRRSIKHIPLIYLRASIAQRRALLAGLIDTDGHTCGTQTSFDNANEQLVRDTAELIRSLGYRAHVHRPTPPKLSTSGVQGKLPMWRVTFSPHDMAPARLPRKVAKWRPALRKHIAITKIERVTPVQGRCITVDSPDGLYCVGEGWTPTHNSSLCAVFAPIRALQLNPNCRIILATYSASLAEDHSFRCRELIRTHGSGVIDPLTGMAVEDLIGFQLSPMAQKVSVWQVDGARGGMIAVGLEGTITGRAADLLIIDDPYKSMEEADSVAHRRKVDTWLASVGRTRLSPQASMVVIQTRWHPEDMSGKIIAGESEMNQQFKTWRHINIPAVAEAGIPDALGRAPGEAMESARGRTRAEFDNTRRDVGDRVWYALYQGVPRNPAGGLFMREWFEPRLTGTPEDVVATIVGVDPAETGDRDETGIIAGALTAGGKVALTEDWSGKMTSDQWGRKAVKLALTLGAREIALEAYAAADTYVSVLKHAYKAIREEALTALNDGETIDEAQAHALHEQPPFRIFKWRAGGKVDAVGRASLLRQALETKRCRTVAYRLAVFEDQAADWQAGQHQPDRVSAAIIAHARCVALAGGQMTLAYPLYEPLPVGRESMLRRRISPQSARRTG